MMKYLYKTMLLALLFVTQVGQTAEQRTQTAGSPSEILINNALMSNNSGEQHYVRIRLVARDRKALHKDQVYQAFFEASMGGIVSDGSYNEAIGDIFINTLSQAGTLVHQMTLKRIGFNQFAVIEYVTTAISPPAPLHNFSINDMPLVDVPAPLHNYSINDMPLVDVPPPPIEQAPAKTPIVGQPPRLELPTINAPAPYIAPQPVAPYQNQYMLQPHGYTQ
ncbi:MAG: hypothetical protein GQ569_08735 [Methylococcaceae bacterium]|nr:hypothetical protein [Methylococcaceae bacterium]